MAGTKREINVQDQPVLGLSRTFSLTIDGIRYRLFRSAVTVAVIAVAIAFLSNISGESLFKRAVAVTTRDRVEEMQTARLWALRITSPGTLEGIIREFSQTAEGSNVYMEYMHFAALDENRMSEFQRDVKAASLYMAFFEGLNYDRRRNMVHTAQGTRIFDMLGNRDRMARFRKALDEMKSVTLVTSIEDMESFIGRWPAVKDRLESIMRNRSEATKKVHSAVGSEPIMAKLMDSEGSFGELIRDAGFSGFDDKTAQLVAGQAAHIINRRVIESALDNHAIRRTLAARKNILPGEVTVVVLWEVLSRSGGAEWLLKASDKEGLDLRGMDSETVLATAALYAEQKALAAAERMTAGTEGGFMGLGARMGWLLLVSMVVCAVGICNAMLMSVTERFREIATLKCLGALDGFIMLMFVMESCFLGLVGGVLGAILGNSIGLIRMIIRFGVRFLPVTPVGEFLVAGIVAVCVGMLLSAVAAVYPSYKAARLAPMEAMRIE